MNTKGERLSGRNCEGHIHSTDTMYKKITNENILYSTRNLLNTLWGPEQEGTQNGGDT